MPGQFVCTTCNTVHSALGNCRSCGGTILFKHDSNPKDNTRKCWVATAYYDDAYHPSVNYLRQYRLSMLADENFRLLMSMLNWFYLKVGETKFGVWWAKSVSSSHSYNWQRYVSGLALKILMSHARRLEGKKKRG